MKYSEAKQGRTFIIRLEDGDVIHEEIEKFARKHDIKAAVLSAVGGVDKDSKLIVGPKHDRDKPVVPMEHILDNVYEVTGTGTIFPDEEGLPVLHMHLACGREASTKTGCIRNGVKVWHILEIVLFEIIETSASRVLNSDIGFKLLEP